MKSRRSMPWPLVVPIAAALIALAAPAPAGAHAVLLKAEPGNDSVLEKAPSRVSLRFNESVEAAFGSLRVYDSSAQRVDDGNVSRPDSEQIEVGIDGDLRDGTYTVTWRVVSADSHPVSGASVFHVGAPGVNPGGIAGLLDEGAPRHVTVALTAARFADFILLLLVAGGAFALAWPLATAAPALRHRATLLIGCAAGALAVVACSGVVLQGAAAGGFGLGEALRWSVVSAVLETRFGEVWLAQAIAALGVAGVAFAMRGRGAALLLPPAAALTLTPGLAGHARATGAVSFVADVAHVLAAAVWTGGLALLVLSLVWAGADRWQLAARSVPRFSTAAVFAVATLLVAGTVNGYLQVRALRGLWETGYGLLLVAKVVLVLPLLALGAYNNRYAVPRLARSIASRVEQRRFLRTGLAELALMVAVVAVTAVLVGEPPARATVGARGPYATDGRLGPLELNLVVDPAEAGANAIHLYLLDDRGLPASVDEARVAASLPSKRVGPLRFTARRLAPGHYSVSGADLAIDGDWQLTVEARRGEFESLRNTFSIPIRKD